MKRLLFLFAIIGIFAVTVAGIGLGTNPIGRNNSDNAFDSSSVAANEDGSMLERLEQIQEGVNKGTGAALPANKSLFDIIGETYTDDGGADHLDDVASHLNLISKYIADGDGDFATGSTLPANKSLYDLLGAYTGDGGADDEDTIMAHLDLIYADTAAVDDFKEKAISKEISTITNGNHDLFVVANGPIKIIEIVAYVTTEIGAESNLVNYNIDPTTPATDTVFGTDGTALETNADAVGTLYTWDGVVANDLTATTNGVALGTAAYSGIIVPAGSIELACANDGSVDGAITVYMRYIPLASGVTVTAAS